MYKGFLKGKGRENGMTKTTRIEAPVKRNGNGYVTFMIYNTTLEMFITNIICANRTEANKMCDMLDGNAKGNYIPVKFIDGKQAAYV